MAAARTSCWVVTLNLLLLGCSGSRSGSYQGYVEGEFVYLSSSQPGHLEHLAVSRGQAALEPLHLLAALLEQTDGIAVPLLRAAGADPADVRSKTEAAIRRLPSVSGATVPAPSPSRDFLRVLNAAGEQASALGDEYVSTEHLLIALADSEGEAGTVLKSSGATRDALSSLQDQTGSLAKSALVVAQYADQKCGVDLNHPGGATTSVPGAPSTTAS